MARIVADEILRSAPRHTVDLLDLYAEKFNPVFSEQDAASYHEQAELPPDVVDHQKRVEVAQNLVLVFPVHWWGMPAMLKGWVDRVFTNGWAFDWSPQEGMRGKLKGLRAHVLCLGGSKSETFSRRGYEASIKKVIGEGVFEYVGASVESFQVLCDSESPEHYEIMREKAEKISLSICGI
ncbi:NAD(P)H-dependent oxidoreductase [Xanthomonas sp. NCPPB 1754]|uniref:NAD(P)H-dependent oxidoreductase n=1 Tax=Xanthomonas sp. NCPPB 1754 TaxID=487536 RepID=UPI003556BA79